MQYIKNISNSEYSAYMSCEGIFRLHFNHNPNEDKIQVGENVVLCQKFDDEKTRGFTHLVTIIDKNVHKDLNRVEFEHYIYVKIIKKGSFPINNTAHWKDIKHGGYMMGKLVNIDNIDQVKKASGLKEKLVQEVWDLFFPNPDANFKETILGTLD